jgi:hypothetical protein
MTGGVILDDTFNLFLRTTTKNQPPIVPQGGRDRPLVILASRIEYNRMPGSEPGMGSERSALITEPSGGAFAENATLGYLEPNGETKPVGMTEHALDAITLVPRERVCGHNQNPLYVDRKIVDVDVYVAGQQRGTWRQDADTDKYGLYLELLDGSGAMTWAGAVGVDSATVGTLKAETANLLVAGKLPTRRQYFDRLLMVFLVDNKLKIAAAVVILGLGFWFL